MPEKHRRWIDQSQGLKWDWYDGITIEDCLWFVEEWISTRYMGEYLSLKTSDPNTRLLVAVKLADEIQKIRRREVTK